MIKNLQKDLQKQINNFVEKNIANNFEIASIEPTTLKKATLEDTAAKEGFTKEQLPILLQKIVFSPQQNNILALDLTKQIVMANATKIELTLYESEGELYLAEHLTLEKLTDVFDFLMMVKRNSALFLNLTNKKSVDLLISLLKETPDYIKYVMNIAMNNLDNIIYCQNQLANLVEELMETSTSEWINVYNINFFFKTYFPDSEKIHDKEREAYVKDGYVFNYVNESFDQFASKNMIKEKLYEANNNDKFPGSNCGLYLQYNTSFKSTKDVSDRITFSKDVRTHLEKITKKKALMGIWNDKELTPGMGSMKNLEENMDIWRDFDFIITDL